MAFGNPPPLSTAAALDFCGQWLPDAEQARLRSALIDAPAEETADAVVSAWRAWHTAFRNTLAAARAARRGVEPGPHLRSSDVPGPTVRAQVVECVKSDDPLQAARALDKLRWEFLDSLSGAHVFDYCTMVCYLLKLRILERWHALATEQGTAALNALMTGVHPQ